MKKLPESRICFMQGDSPAWGSDKILIQTLMILEVSPQKPVVLPVAAEVVSQLKFSMSPETHSTALASKGGFIIWTKIKWN